MIRHAGSTGLFDHDETRTALMMADDRNLSVHTYDQTLADQIYQRLNHYAPLMQHWLQRMQDAQPEPTPQ